MTDFGLQTASIKLRNLTKEFGDLVAVNDVNLDVETGTLVCLLGPSGCGKTTTLRMIAGFEEPTEGNVLIGDEDVTDLAPYNRPTSMVFQSYALFPHMNIFENISYGLKAHGVDKDEIKERVWDALHLMELEGHEKKSPPQLSGGQQQRVALARALVIRPKVLLFDEPLSDLDAQLRVRMRGEIREIQQRLGITSVYVTHDQEEAFSLADVVAIMNAGRLVQLGKPIDLYRTPKDRFVAQFVGISNIVPVELVEERPDDGAVVEVLGEQIRSLEAPSDLSGELSVVLRPEALKIDPNPENGVAARVAGIAYIGPLIRYDLVAERDETELIIDVYNPGLDEFYEQGSRVAVKLPSEVPGVLLG
ncbi:MAG: ABC transporter ATP-binding protein [Anaerolineales bacterium]|nr:ABC transporter ATP-binding protein [Anaerolineales bacterium]